jgi:hypothetical protein
MSFFELLTIIVSVVASVISVENIIILMHKLMLRKKLTIQRNPIININITDNAGNVIEAKEVPLEEAQHLLRTLKKVPETPPISMGK